jgi:hypothetical protein
MTDLRRIIKELKKYAENTGGLVNGEIVAAALEGFVQELEKEARDLYPSARKSAEPILRRVIGEEEATET